MSVTMQTPGLLDKIVGRAATTSGCLVWTGATDRGYGRVFVDGSAKRVHRVVWELTNGPVPDGYELDHLCRVRSCLNVEHLEVVTHAENMRRIAKPRPPKVYRAGPRATHCRKGHEYPPDAPAYGTAKNRCPECKKRTTTNSPGG